MGSLYLTRIKPNEREELIKKLLEAQNYKCFICREKVDLTLHQVDIDHVVPLKLGGKDDPSNFAITHSSCNRSKQDSDLRIARILHNFSKISEKTLREKGVSPNLSDILSEYGGSRYKLKFKIEEKKIKFSFPELGSNSINEYPIFVDELSGFRYFFGLFPIEYLHHDERINPRSIGKNITKLIKEFFLKRPQLHITLGYIITKMELLK
ncbi:MAG: HNH endonuclease family protein [Candidatus Syntrophoarchaeum butanivorans]|uniref:HNH endonuclease family protein n=1 Tax=Candidatus Syntropharchaeum butanivorans TaxID=1839936 RepID=A0A1F2P4U3_9EURY|nr:MAG: HNH endonuclease family protein [Candidatus Syntrophoarchaeum butanivorans]